MKRAALLLFAVILSVYASGQQKDKKAKMNPYFSFTRINAPDKIPCDSMIYYCKFMDVYYPMYASEMIIVMASLDEEHQFIYHRKGKVFEKIPLPINGQIFSVTRCDMETDFTTYDELYFFTCTMSDHSVVRYLYDLGTHKLKERK